MGHEHVQPSGRRDRFRKGERPVRVQLAHWAHPVDAFPVTTATRKCKHRKTHTHTHVFKYMCHYILKNIYYNLLFFCFIVFLSGKTLSSPLVLRGHGAGGSGEESDGVVKDQLGSGHTLRTREAQDAVTWNCGRKCLVEYIVGYSCERRSFMMKRYCGVILIIWIKHYSL